MSTPKMSTAKSLKKSLDNDIKQYLFDYSVDSMSQLVLSKKILSPYNQTTLSQFNIKINNSGKTVTVTKKTQSTINIKPFAFPSFGSKESKVIVMEGKLKEVIKFHILRKHPTKYESCLACRAIRAFLQYEFHQPQHKLKSGMGGLILKEATSSKVGVQSIVVAQPGEASITHPATDHVTTCTTTYSGFKEAQCNCGQIIITWNMKPTPVITPSEMKKIMLKKQAEITSDAVSFLKTEDDLLFEEESDGIN